MKLGLKPSDARLEPAGEERFRLVGELGFGTVMALLKESEEAFAEKPEITLDLAGVTRANSAGIALLVEWLRRARHDKRRLRFVNVPDEALAIARICEVEPLLEPAIGQEAT
ncbi:MAG: STAS domain-containing protein [Gammaproteobacteria bacterium]